jgi:hypothetical protein
LVGNAGRQLHGMSQLASPFLCADRDQKQTGKELTPDQSKLLKVGTQVCFNGDQADRGKSSQRRA